MIYKGYKIEAEVSEFVTYEVNDDGTVNYNKVTSQDGNEITGFYIQNLGTYAEEWLTYRTGYRTIEKVKEYIDRYE